MFAKLFKNKTNPAVSRLYDDVVRQARTPALYRDFAVDDTLDGRFEMVLLHLAPVVDVLRDEAGAITADGQALFDAFLSDMDQNLRTIGVGDLSVPKKMKKIGEAFYGRFDAYRKAHDEASMVHVLERNVYGGPRGAEPPTVAALARYALSVRAAVRTGDPLVGVEFPDAARFSPDVAAESSREGTAR